MKEEQMEKEIVFHHSWSDTPLTTFHQIMNNTFRVLTLIKSEL